MSFLSTNKDEGGSGTNPSGEENGSAYNVSSIYDSSQVVRQNSSIIGDSEEKKNLWSNLLDSVGTRSSSKESHLLMLGDHDSGKRSLLKAMNKPFLKSLAIPIEVFDEYGSNFAPFESSFLYTHEQGVDQGDE